MKKKCKNKKFAKFAKTLLLSSVLLGGGAQSIRAEAPQEAAQVTTNASARSKTVTGFVYDETGEGMPGVNIGIKGSPRGVATDLDGSFKIDVSPTDVLEVSFLGYDLYTVEVGDKASFVIPLKPKASELDEVTVVAFGKQKKSSVVASIETIKASDLRVPASNLTSAFAGKIPGLISYQTSGEPGADNAQFFVRGVTTFGYAASPLILVDGFESTADDLARMTPDDIESFSILKDASAAVLYGSRGANGIILVTTKSGTEGRVKINARVDVNVTTPTQMLEMIDGIEYMQLYNQARVSRDPIQGVYYSEQKIQSTMRGDNPMIYPNVDWYDMLFNKQTVNTKANVNISGGGKIATYFVSAGYENETGLLKVDKRNNFNNNINIDRFNLRNNVIFKLSPSTTLDTRLQARYEKYTGPATSAGDIFNMVIEANPVDFPAVYAPDEDHRWAEHTLFGSTTSSGTTLKSNPYAEMVKGYTTNDESTVTAQATLLQDLDFITEGLKFQAKVSASTWSKYGNTRTFSPFFYGIESYNQVTDVYKLTNINLTTPGSNTLGSTVAARNTSVQYYFEARANWNRTFDKHSVGAMTVLMVQENLFNVGSGDLFETLPERNVGNSGRVTYDFDDRYFAEFGYGYNGSEKFTGSKRFGFFPSIGVGWLVSNEQFWESAKDIVDLLKFKFTWGLVGNDAIAGRSGRFRFLSNVQLGGTNRGYKWGESLFFDKPGYQINQYSNPNIGWEISEKYNIGLELGVLKGSPLKFQVDFFKENRSNIYMERVNYPATSGLEAKIYGNVGKMESQGIDGSFDYQQFFNKDFWLTGRANMTYATNKYVEFDEPEYPDAYRYRKGHPAGQQWGLVAERLFVDDYEVSRSPTQNFDGSIPKAGDIKYTDINGDGKIDSNDQIAMGFPTTPEIQYGFGLSAGYKKFDASFFFQGNARVSFFIDPKGNYDTDNDPANGLEGHGIAPFENRRNALAIVARGAWTETNPDVHAFWPRLSTDPVENNTQLSSWWLRDGSFLRLKTVEAGYTFSGIKKVGMESLRAYFSIENLFVVSPFKQWDPEMGNSGMGYPLNRRFNVGLQLSF
ncbi:TonB-dependent receptor [Candidatus Symbiothrix dinenymphae]|nr:TonB-dependent receptor [Candidatus Symbiothrix dinenymphae]